MSPLDLICVLSPSVGVALAIVTYKLRMAAIGHQVSVRCLRTIEYPTVDALVDDLAARLPGGEVKARGERLDQVVVTGALPSSPRPALLTFWNVIEGFSGRDAHARIELAVDSPAAISFRRGKAMRVSPQGREFFDRNAFLEGVMVQAMSEFRLRSLELENGKLVATGPLWWLAPESFAPLVTFLLDLAIELERVEVKVHVLGGVRRALKGASGGARCSLCHDGITGEEADLVACDRCRTVLHDECWRELGRCPVLGCGGSSPERSRERA